MNTQLSHAEAQARSSSPRQPLPAAPRPLNHGKVMFVLSACMAFQMTGFVMILPLFARRFSEFGAGMESLGTSAMVCALAGTLGCCKCKPRVLVYASGMGFYPSSGDQIITEDTPGGTSFLASLERDGEAVTAPVNKAGVRVVHLRIPLFWRKRASSAAQADGKAPPVDELDRA